MLIGLLVILSTAGLWAYVRYAPALGLVDHPNDRSLHGTPTVVGAGVVPVTLIALYLAMTASFPGAGILATVLMGLTAMGLADDRWGLPSTIRLICYLLAGLILARILLPDYAFISLPVVLAAVAVAWCMNLYNFMDGADGFAAVQALCVAVGLGVIAAVGPFEATTLLLWCAVLFASCMPLLWFNWPPARVFMGDAGAIPLGYFLAALGLLGLNIDAQLGWVWLILMMPFLVDTGLTLILRLLAGEPPHVAHRDHAYQRLALKMGGALPVTLGLMGMQAAWQFPLAVTVVSSALFPPLLVLLSAIPSLAAVVYARTRA